MSTRRDLALGLILAGTASALAGGMAQAKVSEADALEALISNPTDRCKLTPPKWGGEPCRRRSWPDI